VVLLRRYGKVDKEEGRGGGVVRNDNYYHPIINDTFPNGGRKRTVTDPGDSIAKLIF